LLWHVVREESWRTEKLLSSFPQKREATENIWRSPPLPVFTQRGYTDL